MKIYKIRKCISLLFICFIMCYNGFAAIVSSDDGNAFITKHDFEELKKNLNAQIDNYNNSLSDKISGKIASYVSGIGLGVKVLTTVPYASWESVTALNYPIENEYNYPNVSLTVSMLCSTMWDYDLSINAKRFGYESWWTYAQLLYDKPSSIKSKRLLCEAGIEKSSYPDNVIWNGLANDYTDNITLSRTFYCGDHSRFGYLWGSHLHKMALCCATSIKNGYFDDLTNEVDGLWEPKFFWLGQFADGDDRINPYQIDTQWGDAGYRTKSDIYNKSNTTSIVLRKVNNKEKSYEHIINYGNLTYDYFSDTDWIKTLTNVTDNSLTRETFLQDMTTIVGKYSNIEFWNQNHLQKQIGTRWENMKEEDFTGIRVHNAQDLYDIVSGEGIQNYGATTYRWSNIDKTDSTAVVSVGLIPKVYDSEHIKQTAVGFSQVVDNDQYDGKALNLYNGFALLAAKTGDEIEWEPVFVDTYSNDVANNFELNISFAMEPFESENTISSSDKFIKLDGQSTVVPISTTNRSCKVKWTMPDDGIVYIKWWPSSTAIQSTNWRATLDLTKCGSYIRVAS